MDEKGIEDFISQVKEVDDDFSVDERVKVKIKVEKLLKVHCEVVVEIDETAMEQHLVDPSVVNIVKSSEELSNELDYDNVNSMAVVVKVNRINAEELDQIGGIKVYLED